jgi:hypothetical protein
MTAARALSIILAAAAAAGCGAKRIALERMPPRCTFSFDGERFLCDGSPYARLVGRFCRENGATAEVNAVAPGASCRALGIEYADGSRVVLYCAGSLGDMWAPAGDYSTTSKSEFIADWASDIDVDAASRRVTFARYTMLTTSRWSYDVGTGTLVELD